jgi:predicted membrane protein
MTAEDTRGGLPPWLSARLILGVTVLALGLLFTLDRLGVADVGRYARFWPLALVAIGALKLLAPGSGAVRLFGAALVLFGGGLLLNNLHLLYFDAGVIFPLFLLFLGGAIVYQAMGRRGRPAAGDEAAGTVSGFAVLGSVKRRSTSSAFRGGDVSAVLGGCEIDLRQAALAPEGAEIDALAFWGGVEIRVPSDWQVEVRGTPVLGGFEDVTRSEATPGDRRLVVKGLAIMGGVEVRN